MKVLAGLVTQGTGSLGGMTMSKNKQGYYLRSRTVPSNPKTISQTAVRNGLSALAANWTALTQAQRNGWNLYAKNVTIVLDNGQTKILSGFNWYVGANQLRLLASEDVIDDAPTIFTLAGTPQVTQAFYISQYQIGFQFLLLDAPEEPGTGDQLLIQIGRPQSLGTYYFSGPWQYEDTVDSYDATEVLSLALNPDGLYPANSDQNQWLRVTRILPDGRYSTPVHYGPIIGYGESLIAWSSNPWVETLTGSQTGAIMATRTHAASRVIDLGSGYTGLAFSVEDPTTGSISATTTSASSGVYNTVLQVDNGAGTPASYLAVDLTIT